MLLQVLLGFSVLVGASAWVDLLVCARIIPCQYSFLPSLARLVDGYPKF